MRCLLRINFLALFLPIILVLTSCFDFLKEQEKDFSLQIAFNDTTYVGVPLKFWVTFNKPVHDYDQINWERGFAIPFSRNKAKTKDSLSSDTIYLEWKNLPKSSIGADSKLMYKDTVSVAALNEKSKKIIVTVKNIFPELTKVVVNGLANPIKGDSVFISVHRGADLKVSLFFRDELKHSPIEAQWPFFLTGGKRVSNEPLDQASYLFSKAPVVNTERRGPLIVTDGDGASRVWNLHFRTYQEKGSIWVGTSRELLKLSAEGFEIFRITHALDPNMLLAFRLNSLYLLDKSVMQIKKFNSLSYEQITEFSIAPASTPLAMRVDNQFFWEAHQDVNFKDSSRIFKYSIQTGQQFKDTLPRVPGQVLAISLNTNSVEGLWYISSRTNSLYLAEDGKIKLEVENVLERPKLISFDPIYKICWVANENEISMVNMVGNIIGKIRGLSKISSLSAGAGNCWIVDSFDNIVYKLDHSLTKDRDISQRGANELAIDFQHPVYAEMVHESSPSCWVADNGTGSVIKLDNNGQAIARFTGMTAPNVIVVNQGN